jgi:hypothetical protein
MLLALIEGYLSMITTLTRHRPKDLSQGGGLQQQMCRAGNRLQGPALKALRVKGQVAGDGAKRAGRESRNRSRSRKG